MLLLDEPTNDMDTDMLAAMEDLLDTWPGPLIVVSHDRYLLERVTDLQYAVMDGEVRHLPGGVEEYLARRRQAEQQQSAPSSSAAAPASGAATGTPSGAELRAMQKEVSAIERRLQKLSGQIAGVHEQLAAHDQDDYVGLQELTEVLQRHEAEVEELEERWLELSEITG